MKKIAHFSFVSLTQFIKGCGKTTDFDKKRIEECYLDLKKPKRATIGSAGYDFFLPYDIEIKPKETILIPTGIRVQIESGWVLHLYPRSSLGFCYRMQLDNTVGIIDSDYYNADNEGHIFAKITNDSNKDKTILLKKGDAFMQGIFLPFGICDDDETTAIRIGGLGSTSK